MSAAAATLGGRRRMGLCAVMGLLLAVLVQLRIEGSRRSSGVHPLLYLPSGKYLRVMALGFDGLLAEMYNRAGDKRTSLREWSEIYRTSTDDYVRNVAWNHVHDLKVDVDIADLTEAVARFRARQGRPPRRLQELQSSGLLGSPPRDPEDRDYLYDSESGVVRYRGSLVLGR